MPLLGSIFVTPNGIQRNGEIWRRKGGWGGKECAVGTTRTVKSKGAIVYSRKIKGSKRAECQRTAAFHTIRRAVHLRCSCSPILDYVCSLLDVRRTKSQYSSLLLLGICNIIGLVSVFSCSRRALK